MQDKATSPYLNRPLLSERERKLVDELKAAVDNLFAGEPRREIAAKIENALSEFCGTA